MCIHHYYRYQRKYFDEDSILSNLSPGLKEARTQHLHVPMTTLTQAQLHLYCFHHSVCFERAHPEFVMDVVTKLQFEVFLKGEYVIKAGTLGQKMYFVQSGVVDVLTQDGELMTSR